MKYYPVGLKWETKGYHCTILGTDECTDGVHYWLSHRVEWNPKYGYSTKHTKKMSTRKLAKEFKRLGITQPVEDKNHFEEGLFEI
jgi:hypothetical protein